MKAGRGILGRVAGGVATGLCLAAFAPAAWAHDELKPDLAAMPADDLSVAYSGGVRSELRLSTAIANRGSGPLELYPMSGVDCNENSDPADDRLAYQRVFEDTSADGVFDRATDTDSHSYPAGCMTYHPPHDHWHFEDFSRFQLRTPTGDVVAVNDKVSFCVTDTSPFDSTLPGSPDLKHYTTCTPDSIEGISVGWTDVYQSFLPGQFLGITGLSDGDYCVAVKADPSNRLVESDDSNNESLRGISLAGSTVADSARGCVPSSPPLISPGSNQVLQPGRRKHCRRGKARAPAKKHKRKCKRRKPPVRAF